MFLWLVRAMSLFNVVLFAGYAWQYRQLILAELGFEEWSLQSGNWFLVHITLVALFVNAIGWAIAQAVDFTALLHHDARRPDLA